MTQWADFEPLAIMRALAARGVDYVVVGSYAAVTHGSPRLTQDLDISYDNSDANLTALSMTLHDLKARLASIEESLPFDPHPDTLRRMEILTLDTTSGRLDLLAAPAGAPPYARLRKSAARYDLGGVVVLIASIPDLLSMKRAAGRPKDLADIAELEAIERLSR